MTGNLQFINSQLLFQYLECNRKTVTFKVQSGDLDRSFYFEEGKIVWVSSEAAGEQLGTWLVLRNFLPAEELEKTLARARTQGEQFTACLLSTGRLDSNQLSQAVQDLAREVIFRTFNENRGEFQIFQGIPKQVKEGPVRLSAQCLIIEYVQKEEDLAGQAKSAAASPAAGGKSPLPAAGPKPAVEERSSPSEDHRLAMLRIPLLNRPPKDRLELRILPETALQIVKRLRDQDVSGNEISKLILTSPELTARILRMANSPLFGLSREIESIPQAVALLGFQKISRLVLALSLQSMRTRSWFMERRRHIHQLSVRSAFVAHDLAFVLGKDVEDYFILGLMYRLGSILALDILEKKLGPAQLQELQGWEELDAQIWSMEGVVLDIWGGETGLPSHMLEHLQSCIKNPSSRANEAQLLQKAFQLAVLLDHEPEEQVLPALDQRLGLGSIGIGPDELAFLRQLLTASLPITRGVLHDNQAK